MAAPRKPPPAVSGTFRDTSIVARVLALALLTVALAGCTGEAGYGTKEVIEAFRQQGVTLYVGERPKEGDILAPRGELSFVVLVATDESADEEWNAYLAQSDPRSFDARERNVLVVSDNGDLDPRLRRRIRAALGLAPRGLKVRGSDEPLPRHGSADGDEVTHEPVYE